MDKKPLKLLAGGFDVFFFYLKHICVIVVAVLHHHRLVPGQGVGDTVLTFTVGRLQGDDKKTVNKRDAAKTHKCEYKTSLLEAAAGARRSQDSTTLHKGRRVK